MPPQFTKFHGLGNDYLVIETEQLAGIDDLGEFARRICNRHYGAGGDGIAIVGRSSAAFSIPTAVRPDFRATALVAPSLISTTAVFGVKRNCASARAPV